METSVNNKCRAFTSLEQSKKLAEFLPLESADMRIGNYVGKSGKVDGTNIHYYTKGESFGAPEIINAWSLAALLDVLPKNIKSPFGEINPFIGQVDVKDYRCVYLDGDWDSNVQTNANNPVDACYEMIIKLHEQNLL